MWTKAIVATLVVMALIAAAAGVFSRVPAAASPGDAREPQPQDVTVVEHVGAEIPRDLQFTDDDGHTVPLGSLLDGTPTLLTLAYFSCPMLCPVGVDAAADAIRSAGATLGRNVRAVTVSIDPRDTPDVAREWRVRAAQRLHANPDSLDWHFLVSRSDAARRLAERVGFQYAYDAGTGQYSHPTTLIVVGRDGRVSRYLYGIDYKGKDVADAIDGARQNRRVSSVAAFVLRCFHYIPAARAHGGTVLWMLRACGALVSGGIGATLFALWRRERA